MVAAAIWRLTGDPEPAAGAGLNVRLVGDPAPGWIGELYPPGRLRLDHCHRRSSGPPGTRIGPGSPNSTRWSSCQPGCWMKRSSAVPVLSTTEEVFSKLGITL